MAFEDIKIFLSCFNEEMQDLQKRFEVDSVHNLFLCYIPMSQNIKKKVSSYLNPLLKELEVLDLRYGEKYRSKDIEFHIKQASVHVQFIKQSLKEIYDMYESQQKYEEIAKKWPVAFTNLSRRLPLINSRLMLIEKILEPEAK